MKSAFYTKGYHSFCTTSILVFHLPEHSYLSCFEGYPRLRFTSLGVHPITGAEIGAQSALYTQGFIRQCGGLPCALVLVREGISTIHWCDWITRYRSSWIENRGENAPWGACNGNVCVNLAIYSWRGLSLNTKPRVTRWESSVVDSTHGEEGKFIVMRVMGSFLGNNARGNVFSKRW